MKRLILLLVLTSVILGGPANAEPPPSFILKWGSEGRTPGQFRGAHGLGVDANDYLYVADLMNLRIQKFDAGGNFVTQWLTQSGPDGLAIAPNGNIYVTEPAQNKVEYFTPSGTRLGAWGQSGNGPGRFDPPGSIAVDDDGDVYVHDGNQHIQKFTSTGAFMLLWGSDGEGIGEFHGLKGLAADHAGHIYAADVNRIQAFTPGGAFLYAWPIDSSNPQFLACDAAGNVFVTDSNDDRVLKYSPSGTLLTSFGHCCLGDGEFLDPQGMAFDATGNIFVSESLDGHNGNNRVQKFGYLPTPVLKPSWGEVKLRYR